jgi:hypothetical protein
MKEKLTKQDIGFTQIKNEVLQDKNLSFKAKGLFSLIYSKSNDWDFSVKRLALESTDQFASVNSGIKELEDSGYLERKKLPSGRKEWQIRFNRAKRFVILKEKPSREKAYLAKSLLGKTTTISNKEFLVTKKAHSNKENYHNLANQRFAVTSPNNKSIKEISPINPLIKLFEPINPTYDSFYKNKTQRSALERLVKRFGTEKTGSIIKALEVMICKKYCPTVTSPLELEQKLGKLVAFHKQEQDKPKKGLDFAIIN